LIASRKPGSLAAPEWLQHVSTCIEDDDLESAGISHSELENLIAGPDRGKVKTWIESLPIEMRVIFVLRAVAGFTANETAAMLAQYAGQGAEQWNADAVREIFRQGLCSLASQLIHAVR
jgi:DNA-directed RNA polymerase specialized sigma24 family protein